MKRKFSHFSDEEKSASVLNYVGYDLKKLDELARKVESTLDLTSSASMDEIFEYLLMNNGQQRTRPNRTFLRVVVTTTEEYMIDMDCTDGLTPDEVIDEWFRKYSMSQHHAARDHCKVGNSKKLIGVENHGLIEEGSKL